MGSQAELVSKGYLPLVSSLISIFLIDGMGPLKCKVKAPNQNVVELTKLIKTFLLVPRRASNYRHTTSWGVNIV